MPEEEIDVLDNLMESLEPEPRVFLINNAAETTLLGMLEEENEDSFLVFLPSRMIKNEDETYSIIPYTGSEHVRIMKSGVLCVSPMFEPFEEPFLKYFNECIMSDEVENPEGPEGLALEASESLKAYLEKAYDEGRVQIGTIKPGSNH